MSDDLLKRAAGVLREMAGKAQSREPWCAEYTWSAVRHVQRNCEIECGLHGDVDDGQCSSFDMYDGRYVALMHPPVALALADLLEEAAFVAEGNGLVDDDRYKAEAVLARAILRQEAP